MQTMLERIAEAEQEADRIIEEANIASRERIAKAKANAEDAVNAALAAEREKTAAALSAAERQGEADGAQILAAVHVEIESMRKDALQKLPQAVTYLQERIEATL